MIGIISAVTLFAVYMLAGFIILVMNAKLVGMIHPSCKAELAEAAGNPDPMFFACLFWPLVVIVMWVVTILCLIDFSVFAKLINKIQAWIER